MADVRVKQKSGSITIRRGGEEPVTRHVTDHIVQVADGDVEHFVANVDGSSIVAEPAKKEK